MIFFILGLLLGIGISWWYRYQLKAQLRKILTASPDTTPGLLISLPPVSLIKREILYLRQQTQQKEEELHLRRQSLEHIPIAYLLVDEENQLIWCNQQAQKLLHLDRWQPQQIRLLLELVRSYELDQLIEHTRHTQTPQIEQWVFHSAPYIPPNASGDAALSPRRSCAIALKASSYPLPDGQVEIFIENQQPLVELSRSRDRAFSDLTHELRTPLTSISLVAEVLQGRLQNPERRWAEQMLQETHRLIHLVEDWLDLSQISENPHQSLTYELIELREVILSAWRTLEPLAQSKQVSIGYHQSSEIQFWGDRSRLIQVFLNLLDNSLKHSPPQTEITVKSSSNAENQFITIDIIDWGSGFEKADLPHIFDRLYRGDPSRTRQGSQGHSMRQGSGLGLAIAQEIVHAHGGTLTANNHPQTGGAWIQLSFPTTQPE